MLNGRPASNYSPLGPDDKVQSARGGGIEWTIKDGIPYHVPTLMREVKEMVSQARAQRVRSDRRTAMSWHRGARKDRTELLSLGSSGLRDPSGLCG